MKFPETVLATRVLRFKQKKKNEISIELPFGVQETRRKCKRTPRKRPAMPTDFSKRLPGLEAREGRRGTCGAAELRETRPVSPEKAARQHEDNRGGGSIGGGHECGRSDARLGRWSPGSSPEPEDNSSTSGDEGTPLLVARMHTRVPALCPR